MGKIELFKKIATICFALIPLASAGNEPIEINRIVARVNDRIITLGEIDRAMDRMNFTDTEKTKRLPDFVDGKIDRLLSISAFEEQGMAMPESYIEQEYNKKLINEFNGDRRLFRDVLRGNGQSQLEYRENLKGDIIHMHMLSSRKRKMEEVSPGRVENYYKQNMRDFRTDRSIRLCEIVLTEDSVDSSSNPEAFSKQVWLKLKSGEPFEKLAKIYGESTFKKDGGDWGVFASQKEIRNEALRKQAFLLKEGTYSSPFKVPLLERKADGTIGASGRFAYYILFAKEVREGGFKNIDQVRPEIEKILADEIESKSQRKWLSRQKRSAYVHLSLP